MHRLAYPICPRHLCNICVQHTPVQHVLVGDGQGSSENASASLVDRFLSLLPSLLPTVINGALPAITKFCVALEAWDEVSQLRPLLLSSLSLARPAALWPGRVRSPGVGGKNSIHDSTLGRNAIYDSPLLTR